MRNQILPVKGTRDFYPEQKAIHSWLRGLVKQISERFGYQEYEGPCIERVALYAAKSGDELVKEQAFVFEDRGGDLITLRPELTPILARMIAQKQNELTFPVRWWQFGPFWRYEKPQKGRAREFFQWNIDLIGANSIAADAEILAIGALFLRETGLTPNEVKIHVNNRRLMNQELENLGINSDRIPIVFRWIDRKGKLQQTDWEGYGKDLGLTEFQVSAIASVLSDPDLWKRSDELVRLFGFLSDFGVADYVVFDPEIIRGLDYYTGTVFETHDRDGEFRAILGGGRYDNLVASVGGDPLPGVGFAMGDAVISLVLAKFNRIPKLSINPAKVLVTVFDESLLPVSIRVARDLREAGISAIHYPEVAKLQKQMKFADRMEIHLVLIIGPDEQEQDMITIKDLFRRDQVTVKSNDIVAVVAQILARDSAV